MRSNQRGGSRGKRSFLTASCAKFGRVGRRSGRLDTDWGEPYLRSRLSLRLAPRGGKRDGRFGRRASTSQRTRRRTRRPRREARLAIADLSRLRHHGGGSRQSAGHASPVVPRGLRSAVGQDRARRKPGLFSRQLGAGAPSFGSLSLLPARASAPRDDVLPIEARDDSCPGLTSLRGRGARIGLTPLVRRHVPLVELHLLNPEQATPRWLIQ